MGDKFQMQDFNEAVGLPDGWEKTNRMNRLKNDAGLSEMKERAKAEFASIAREMKISEAELRGRYESYRNSPSFNSTMNNEIMSFMILEFLRNVETIGTKMAEGRKTVDSKTKTDVAELKQSVPAIAVVAAAPAKAVAATPAKEAKAAQAAVPAKQEEPVKTPAAPKITESATPVAEAKAPVDNSPGVTIKPVSPVNGPTVIMDTAKADGAAKKQPDLSKFTAEAAAAPAKAVAATPAKEAKAAQAAVPAKQEEPVKTPAAPKITESATPVAEAKAPAAAKVEKTASAMPESGTKTAIEAKAEKPIEKLSFKKVLESGEATKIQAKMVQITKAYESGDNSFYNEAIQVRRYAIEELGKDIVPYIKAARDKTPKDFALTVTDGDVINVWVTNQGFKTGIIGVIRYGQWMAKPSS